MNTYGPAVASGPIWVSGPASGSGSGSGSRQDSASRSASASASNLKDTSRRSSYYDPRTDNAGASQVTRDWRSSTSAHPPDSRTDDLYRRPRHLSDVHVAAITSPSPSAVPTLAPIASSASSADTHYDAALFINLRSADTPGKKVQDHQIPILTNKYMHSPLITLNRFITKIPSFLRLLRPDMDRSLDVQLSSLITDENICELQAHLPLLRMWHPHIPDLDPLRSAYFERPKPSTSLLLASLCLVTSKLANRRHLAKHFAVHVDRIGLQVLISAPKELHAAQAFELLLAHQPSLIGASVDPTGSNSAHSAVFGESLQSSAIAIAEGIGLDLAMTQASQEREDDSNVETAESNDRLRVQLQHFSLWCSLSIWRSKFVFLNSVIRPQDFSRLRNDAQIAIKLVDQLRPSSPTSSSSSGRDPSETPRMDDVMFRAGILALAHRAFQVADFNQHLAQLETLSHSRALFTEVEVRRELSSRLEENLDFLDDLIKTKRSKLWSLGNLPQLKFLDRWIDLEFESDREFLFQLYMRSVLPRKGELTVADVSDSIGSDDGLFRFMFDAARRSYLRSERALAGFAGAPRFEGESIDQTGLPLLLTCGYLLHISIGVMEGTNFVQIGSVANAVREDMFALLLPLVADRLSGFAKPGTETLERFVSSMLVQMSRRLDDWTYVQATRDRAHAAEATAAVSQAPPDYGTAKAARSTRQNGQSLSRASNNHLTSQNMAAPASDSSVTTPHTDMTPTSWHHHQTSNASQSDTSRQSLNSNTQQPSSRMPGMTQATNSVAAVPFSSSEASLMGAADALSADNMARIMDQILSWDCVPSMGPMPAGNGF